MNKIRGSVIAKLTAWILCISCALGTAAFGLLTIVGIEEGLFDVTRETALTEIYKSVNASYSTEAYQSMKSHRKEKNFAEEGFRYGIFQTKNLAKEDFKDKKLYIDTNMTDKQLQNMDVDKLYLYSVWELSNGGSKGSPYGCVGDWEDLSALQNIAENLQEQGGIVWNGQYADAVCFDTVKGIFYYRSDNYYYPVPNVSMYYIDDWGIEIEYNYVYDFEKGMYKLDDYYTDYDKSVYELGEMSIAVVEDADEIEKILKGDKTGGYIDFCALNKTQFNYLNWGTMMLDGVRAIDSDDFTIIHSDKIKEEYFVDPNVTGYYLDENYTLYVALPAEVTFYWVASLIPEEGTPMAEGSGYLAAAKGIELFYKYGDNACSVMVFFAIMTLASFIFLAYASGHRKGKEEIVLTWFDKLPLEVWSAAVFFAFFVPLSTIGMIENVKAVRNNLQISIPLIISAFVVICMIALWYALGLCVRIKYGKWWRNTLCYKIFSTIKKAVKSVLDNITLLWKLMLFLFVKFVIELFLVMEYAEAEFAVLWLIETILVCVVAFRAAPQINELQKAAGKMAEGNLGYKVHTEKMFSICKMHGDNLNKIGEGLSKAVDERMKSERFKTELITNVSHDIKTPLTSIINYVDLLEKEELHNEKAEEYLDVLERQSSKLKKLIEDLVEASKASTGNLEVGNELLEAGVFLTQTVGEFEEKLSLSGLELIVKKPEKPIYISADGRHLWRVVDNLMSNICKYAQPSSRVYVNLEKENDNAVITFRNISKYQLNINGDELVERFIRGDSSRNTEGHGLGLSIAKSLMDLMGGGMQITVDGDLFKVRLDFKLQDNAEEILRQHEEKPEGDEGCESAE